jgi:deoxyguanosine kinase
MSTAGPARSLNELRAEDGAARNKARYTKGQPSWFLAIEGPTGAGKSTLVRRLSRWLDVQLMFDPFEANPFLSMPYTGDQGDSMRGLDLATELTFLALRITQLREIDTRLKAGSAVLADWALLKQSIFAGLTLGAVGRQRMVRTCAVWCRGLPDPDLLIYLRAGSTTLRERITRRRRAIEAGVSDEHLKRLIDEYDCEMARYSRSVLTVDADRLDVFDDRSVEAVVERIRLRLPPSPVGTSRG